MKGKLQIIKNLLKKLWFLQFFFEKHIDFNALYTI